MIIDTIENSNLYPYGAAWKKAFEFLENLTSQSSEGRFEIQGDQIFARIMSYETKKQEDAILETHQRYVDIQAILEGGECLEWYPSEGLTTKIPYNDTKDAEFYIRPETAPVQIKLYPGTFVTLFPQDAHMPSLEINNTSELIKKVVIKLDLSLLEV